jgi:hypothetical protein
MVVQKSVVDNYWYLYLSCKIPFRFDTEIIHVIVDEIFLQMVRGEHDAALGLIR